MLNDAAVDDAEPPSLDRSASDSGKAARSRLLKGKSLIVGANRVNGGLEALRAADAEAKKRESSRLRHLEMMRLAEQHRLAEDIRKANERLRQARETREPSTLAQAIDEISAAPAEVLAAVRVPLRKCKLLLQKLEANISKQELERINNARVAKAREEFQRLMAQPELHYDLQRELDVASEDPFMKDALAKEIETALSQVEATEGQLKNLFNRLNRSVDEGQRTCTTEGIKKALHDFVNSVPQMKVRLVARVFSPFLFRRSPKTHLLHIYLFPGRLTPRHFAHTHARTHTHTHTSRGQRRTMPSKWLIKQSCVYLIWSASTVW